MTNNFKFRTNPSIVIHNNRRQRRFRWALPLLVLAIGGIYAALQLEPGTESTETSQSDGTVNLPLALPHSPAIPGTPAATAKSAAQPAIVQAPAQSLQPLELLNGPAQRTSQRDTAKPTETQQNPFQTPLAADTAKPVATTPSESRWLTHEIKSGDTLARIFDRFELSPSLLHRIINSGKPAKQLNRIRPGQLLSIELDGDKKFSRLKYEIDPVKTLRVVRNGDNLTATLDEKAIEQRNAEISGTIESSLFLSAQRAGLSDRLTLKLAEIFGWDIDFALEIRSGDRFSVVYEEEWLDGEKFKDGNILAAEFVNRGKVYRAVRYKGPDGREDYYTPDGKRMRKTFLRTPVKFSRISSGFTKRRWHPVLKKWRSHKGVDYAAPRGTPVKSAGDGKITFVGRKSGYGKVIYIQHEGIYTTVYGHLNGFAKGIRKGKRVGQGQLIGYVGSTGLATGPHLHYEFRVNGKHRNPLKVTFAPAAPLKKKYLRAFQKATQPLLAKLDSLNSTLVADAL